MSDSFQEDSEMIKEGLRERKSQISWIFVFVNNIG